MIQNTLGSALDNVESIRNAFNFTVRCLRGDVPLYNRSNTEMELTCVLPSLTGSVRSGYSLQ